MTDAELDTLLANAKPYKGSWLRCWDESERHFVAKEVFDLLVGGEINASIQSVKYRTEAAAMDALRDAVAKYKEQRT